ncbi:MAG: hypothetical protein Q9M89_02020 [Persephonella sp.]|nr:hypothetical protein [Persephonella sp.]
MKRFTAAVLSSASIITVSYAKDVLINTSFYGSYMDYSSSAVKDDGYIGGVYGYAGIGLEHSVEVEIDYTKINYPQAVEALKQWDFTVMYTNYSVRNTKIRIGGHYINSDDSATDGGIILTGGYEFYTIRSYSYGLDIALSYYDNYNIEKTYIRSLYRGMGRSPLSYTTTTTGLWVYQISPKLSYSFPETAAGDVYLETRGYYIRTSDDVGFGKNFFSVECSLNLDTGIFEFNLYGWIGEQEFAVKKYGFAVYNLSEKYKNGFGASIKYKMSEKSSVTVGIKRETFRELDNPRDVKISSLYFLAEVNF